MRWMMMMMMSIFTIIIIRLPGLLYEFNLLSNVILQRIRGEPQDSSVPMISANGKGHNNDEFNSADDYQTDDDDDAEKIDDGVKNDDAVDRKQILDNRLQLDPRHARMWCIGVSVFAFVLFLLFLLPGLVSMTSGDDNLDNAKIDNGDDLSSSTTLPHGWIEVPLDGSRCARGSPYSFFYRPGDSKTLVV
jgi:hypothetical protein